MTAVVGEAVDGGNSRATNGYENVPTHHSDTGGPMTDQDRAVSNEPDTTWIARPGPEHRWLERLVGEWEFTPPPPPDLPAPPGGSKLVQRFRSLHGTWVMGESDMPVPDGTMGTAIITLGYDPARGRFTGTWIGSMMNHLWVYDGVLDADRRVLSLETTGPAMDGSNRMQPYRDSVELVDDDHYVLRSAVQDDSGEWREFMAIDYRRRL